MIPPRQLVHLRLRDRHGIQAGMRRRGVYRINTHRTASDVRIHEIGYAAR